MRWLRLRATEDGCYRSRVSTHRGSFNVPAHGFPSNRPTHNFLDWGGFVSTLRLQRTSSGKRFSSGGPGGPSSQTPAPGPGGAAAPLVFRVPARPGLNAELRRVCEGSAPASGPEGRRGLLGRGREADAGAAHRSRAGGIRGANTCGHKGGLDGASPGGADRPESLLRQGQERWAFSAFQAPPACGRVGSRRRRPADALEGVISGR